METNKLIILGSMAMNPDQVHTLVERLAKEVALRLVQDQPDQETRHKQVLYCLESIQKQLERLGNDREVLSQSLETQKVLSQQFYDHQIIEPMVRGLFPVVDMIHDTMVSSDSPRHANWVKGVNTQLSQFLATFGIEVYSHETEQPFDPKCMKPLKQITTYDRQLNGLIAESLQCGFKSPGRILRMESVSIYQYQLQQKGTLPWQQ